jgi:hypothetical protein
VQWEFAGRLGPPPGRYVVRRFAGDEVRMVVVVGDGSGPRRRSRREPPESVPVTCVTVIDAESLPDDATAAAWLRKADVTPVYVSTLERLLASHRVASADAAVADADPTRALRLRIGYGTGEQVADGTWTEARELSPPEPPSRSRRDRHRPAERLAALLAARDATLACEELTLRARADLDRGRAREAALQLEAALTAALAELAGWLAHGDLAARLDELAGYREAVGAAASAAREGRLDAAAVEDVGTALARLEAALRARAIYAAEAG